MKTQQIELTPEEFEYYEKVYDKVLDSFKQGLHDSMIWIVRCKRIGMSIDETAGIVIDHYNKK